LGESWQIDKGLRKNTGLVGPVLQVACMHIARADLSFKLPF